MGYHAAALKQRHWSYLLMSLLIQTKMNLWSYTMICSSLLVGLLFQFYSALTILNKHNRSSAERSKESWKSCHQINEYGWDKRRSLGSCWSFCCVPSYPPGAHGQFILSARTCWRCTWECQSESPYGEHGISVTALRISNAERMYYLSAIVVKNEAPVTGMFLIRCLHDGRS